MVMCLRCLLCFLLVVCGFSAQKGTKTIYCHQKSPGNTAVLFAPEIFNYSQGYHSSPVFSNEGNVVLYSKMKEKGDMSMRLSENWNMDYPVTFSGFCDSGNPFLSYDNRRLYFMSFQPVEGSSTRREHIWVAEKCGNTWTDPEPLGPCILKHFTHWQFSLSRNHTLVFMSESRGEQNQDIFWSTLSPNGQYTEPTRLPDEINTPFKEFTPFISIDESFLIFARLDNTTEKSDLFISRKGKDNHWKLSEKLPDTINSKGHDLCPIVSPDGKYLFFLSTRTGISRMYWVNTFFLNN